MKTGAAISGGVHLAILAVAFFGLDWFSDRADEPLTVTEIEFVDGTELDAMVSSDPFAATKDPNELSKPGEGDPAPERPETPQDRAAPAETPVLTEAPEPDRKPTPPEIAFNTPTNVPTEEPKPSIAIVPSADPLDRQSTEPESPPATDPLQPLASIRAPVPSDRPQRPPEPEPEPEKVEKTAEVSAPSESAEETKKPDPEPVKETDPDSAEEKQPDAPDGLAPQEARLPIAKPADLAAAAEPSRKAEEEKVAETKPAEEPVKTAEATTKPETPKEPERTTTRNSGGGTRYNGPPLNRSETNALRVGVKKYYTYNGDRSDPSLQVKVVIKLTEQGVIDGKPEIVGASSATERALGLAGQRALIRASNAGEFKVLPIDKYNHWQRLNFIFTIDRLDMSS